MPAVYTFCRFCSVQAHFLTIVGMPKRFHGVKFWLVTVDVKRGCSLHLSTGNCSCLNTGQGTAQSVIGVNYL